MNLQQVKDFLNSIKVGFLGNIFLIPNFLPHFLWQKAHKLQILYGVQQNFVHAFWIVYYQDGSKTKLIEILENDQQMIGQIIQCLMTHQNNEVKLIHYFAFSYK
jgi:hypothetical protein